MMADESPPSKRQKTEGDGFLFQLENQLPDELMESSGTSNGPSVSINHTPLSQTQATSTPSAVTAGPSQQHSMPMPHHPKNVQTHKQLTQLLQSGHNSPKYVGTPSPSNSNAINSPRPPRQPSQPQPSPLSTSHNSLQSPSAGSMAAVMNNMKSPPGSLPRPNSRPSSAMNATPSPRPGSLPGGPMSVGSSNPSGNSSSSVANVSMRSPMMVNQMPQQMNQQNMPAQNMAMHGGMQKYSMMNGPSRSIQGMAQQGMTMSNRPTMQNGGINTGVSMNQMGNQQPGMQIQSGHYNNMMQQHMPTQVNQMNSMQNPMNSFSQQTAGSIQAGPMSVGMQRQMPLNSNSNTGFSTMPMSRSLQQQNMQGLMSQASGGMQQNQLAGSGAIAATGMPANNNMNLQMMSQPNGNMVTMDKPNPNMQFNSVRPVMQPNNNSMQQQISRLANQLDPQVQNMGMNVPTMAPSNQPQMQQHMQAMGQPIGQANPMQQQVPQASIGTGPAQQLGQMTKTAGQTGTSNSSAPADPEKRRLIQQQLVLLLHAYKCAKKEHNGETPNCNLPHCRTMKEVLRHMNVCTQGKSCQVAHCASSRQIIAHWRACSRHDCVVCLPLRTAPNNNNAVGPGASVSVQPRWPASGSAVSTSVSPSTSGAVPPYPSQMNDPMLSSGLLPSNNVNVTSGTSNLPNGLGQPNQMPGISPMGSLSQSSESTGNLFHVPRVEREWHKDVTEELRNHLVQKLVQAIFPTPQKVSLTDERMKKLVTFARKVEGDMYEQANNRSEYYHLLAEKIYKIQKELEEKRSQRVHGRPRPVNAQRMPMNGSPMGQGANQVMNPMTRGLNMEQYHSIGPGGRMPVPNLVTCQLNAGGQIRMDQPQIPNNSMPHENVIDNLMPAVSQTHGQQSSLAGGNQTAMNSNYSDTIMKFKLASDEIRQQRKQTPPLHGSQAQGMPGLQQTNITGMNSNMIPNQSMPSGINNFQDQQSKLVPSSAGSNIATSHMNQQMAKVSSAQPRLESLLLGTGTPPPSSSLSDVSSTSVSTGNNYFGTEEQQNAFNSNTGTAALVQRTQVCPSPSADQSQFVSQQPSSLQEILQGPISSSVTTSTTTTTIASSMEMSKTLNSSTTTSATVPSPSPFISKPQIQMLGTASSTDMENQSNVASSLPNSGCIDKASASFSNASNNGMMAKHKPVDSKTEAGASHSNMSSTSNGKAWSPSRSTSDTRSSWTTSTPISSVKTEVKMETDSESAFPASSATTTTTSTATTLAPFVKQENMNTTTLSAPSTPATPAKSKCPKKVFEPLELKNALMPVVEKLYRQEPESLPFRQPVDPEKLSIPDYFEIVKEPMDLSSIRKNLETGKYQEPWEFMNDIWLMFNNAWLYNRRTTRVYKYCSKLKEIFEIEIDPVMQSLGYCCGRKMEFMPMTLCCYGKQLCTIPTGATYYEYQNRYDYCEKCFNEIPGDSISLADDPNKPHSSVTTIPKSQFEKKKNVVLDPEPFETCIECGRKMHKICVLHMSPIWPEGFTCDKCHAMRNTQRKPNRYVAAKLPQNKLGEHIERRVNNYIKHQDTNGQAGHVHIRVVYSGDKTVEVRSGMKTRFVDTKEMPETFPYRAKAFFAFEEIDGVDVCFFGVHVQEYGSDAPKPNQRRIYLSYLDSVHFFRPRHLRTAVYHEILIGYFEYCKMLGYEFAHIWACPPCEGDDYIFHCHPPEQKIPKPKRLQDWYKKMLDKAISEQVIVDYKDIFHQAKEDRLQSARELPYFEGDFWPNVLEESIKEIEQEEEDRKRAEANEQAAAEESDQGSSCSSKNGKNKKSKKANSKKASQRTTKKKLPQIANDLSDKLYQTMEKHKEVFFVIRLNSVETISKMGPTSDPDTAMQCDLMDGRDAFLTLAREKHYEFSSLRRAKWSTMAMLVELHTQGQDKFSYVCNNCKNNVETRYQCTVCHDFDLCVNCYRMIGHEHKMEKMGFDLVDGSTGSPGAGSSNTKSSQIPVEKCMQSLVHACQCRNANCNQAACLKMKKVVHHAKNCKKKTNGTCPICKQLIALCCYHAKHCQEKKCPVAFCHNIKNKLKQQEQQQRFQQAYLMRRRMALMSRNIASNPSGAPSTPQQSQASPKPQMTPDHHMHKPQPSPMTNMKNPENTQLVQTTQNPQQRPGMDGSNGIQGGMVPIQIQNQQPQQHIMTSPQIGNIPQQQAPGMVVRSGPDTTGMMVNQQAVGGLVMSSPMAVNQQQHGIMSPPPSLPPGGFGSNKYPPPEAAVKAAKQAQQLADKQAREKLASFPNPNQVRAMNPGMQRAMVPNSSWPMQSGPMHRTGRPMMTGQQGPSMMAGGQGQAPMPSPGNAGPNANQSQSFTKVLELLKQESNRPVPPGGRGGRAKSSEQLMNLIKTNPHLMSTIIKQRKIQQQNKQMNQKIVMTQQHPGGMAGGNVQQSNMGGGMQQMVIQNTVNQPVMNMQPMQGGMGNLQQMQWQQQQRRLQQQQQQQQQQQGQFQTPAPPYPQAINQQRMMNMRFQQQQQQQQHRMQTPIRHQTPMNQPVQGGMTMQQGMMGQPVSNVQGVQSPIPHHQAMMNPGTGSQVATGMGGQQVTSSQAMAVGRVGTHMSPHPMAGRTTPLGQGQVVNQGSTMSHMVTTMDQQFSQAGNQPGMMPGGFSRGMNPNMNPHAGGGMGFNTNVNQELGPAGNAMPGQEGLEHFVKTDQ